MTAFVPSDPMRHPWFGPPTLKRKHSDPDSDNEGEFNEHDSRTSYPTPPSSSSKLGWSGSLGRAKGAKYSVEESSDADSGSDTRAAGVNGTGNGLEKKRRRCDAVERRMARMSLEGNANANLNTNATGMDAEPLDVDVDVDFADASVNDIQRNFCRPSFGATPVSAPLSMGSNSSSSDGYVYTSGSLSPVSKGAILSQYAVEEPSSPEASLRQDSLPTMRMERSFSVEEIQAGNAVNGQQPVVREVRMGGAEPAWYEREKDHIVITNIDEAAKSDDEDEYKSEAEPYFDVPGSADSSADFNISSALLDHFKRKNNLMGNPDVFSLAPKAPKEDGALVLYQPLPGLGVTSLAAANGDGEDNQIASNGFGVDLSSSSGPGVSDDDAMDIDS